MDGLLFVGHWADHIIGWRKEKIKPSNRWPHICRAPCSLCVLPFHIMFSHISKFLLTARLFSAQAHAAEAGTDYEYAEHKPIS